VAVAIDPDFEDLLHFLKESRGFDFTGYKRSSLMRRVDRRMQQVGVASYSDYLDRLQVDQEEFTQLFNTILINVTGFFRDPEAWIRLQEKALPELLASRKPQEPIRVWCAGSASGEEAYTAAMVLTELLGAEAFREQVKIYATDVDEEALAQARQASYDERALKPLPDPLREKYFETQNRRFVFRADLRRSIIFGRNDLVQDAPISRVDWLICRNTLMYFNAETQAKILSRFHFALTDSGLLFLGKAEMLLIHTDLFVPVDLKRRFFRKVPRTPVNGGLTALVSGLRDPAGELGNTARLRLETLAASPVATIVVTRDGLLASANQRAETLFNLSDRDVGRPFRDLEVSYRPTELRAVVEQVTLERRPTTVREVEWVGSAAENVYLDIQVVPLVEVDGQDAGVALFFDDVSRYRKLQGELEYSNRQLETAYEELQSTVEELETTNEELQSTVEELETTNEELQSTNEELETMNEELQSTNDELQTINDELRVRTQELDDTNAFTESILRSLRGAVIVVDTDLIVRVWNKRAEDLWGARADEVVGQHFLGLDIGLPTERLKPLLRKVLSSSDGSAEDLTVEAINRKGRSIQVRVVGSALNFRADATAAILVIDEL
jgi:two-component system CheB/CheR fusion protein